MADEHPQSKISVPRVSKETQGTPNESRIFIGAPDFRVFIWGIEVTTDVFSVSTVLTMNDNVSTATINMVNDNEKWVLPTGLAATDIDVIPDELSESTLRGGSFQGTFGGLAPGTNTKTGRFVTPIQFAKLKRKNMKKRLSADSRGGVTIAQLLLEKIQSSHLFPFLPGRPLIQMNDPIRIFLKNPWKLDGIEEEEEWYFAFTGYIASVTEDFDAQSNRSIIRCACEDIRRLLRYMRTSTNPTVFNFNVLQQDTVVLVSKDAEEMRRRVAPLTPGRASDVILMSGNQSFSAGMLLVNRNKGDSSAGVMETLLFGDVDQGSIEQGNKGEDAPNISGVLGFRQGGKEILDLTVDDNFEANLSESLDLIYPILSPSEVTIYGRDWSLGDVNVNPGVTPNKLWVIMPSEEQFISFRDPFRWDMRIDFFTEFKSRLDIINEFVKNIDCIWYATPKGDIVVEFPNYDATPHLHAAPWKSILTLQNEWSRFSSTEDDRNIKTLTVAVGSAVEGWDTSADAPFLAYYPFANPELIARYGIREQRQNRPYYHSNKTITDALPQLAAMWQELANADAYRLEGLEMLPNFRAAPGRPYMFKFRNIIGFAESVQHQVVWNEMAQTVYTFNYLRHFDARAGVWQKLSGNYGWHWKPSLRSDSLEVGPDYVQGRRNTSDRGDETSRRMEELHQDIIQQENLMGKPLLTPEQHGRLNQITSAFQQQSLLPEDRAALIDEYNGIVAQGDLGLTL